MQRRSFLKLAATALVGLIPFRRAVAKSRLPDLHVGLGQVHQLPPFSRWGTITIDGGTLVFGHACIIETLNIKRGIATCPEDDANAIAFRRNPPIGMTINTITITSR